MGQTAPEQERHGRKKRTRSSSKPSKVRTAKKVVRPSKSEMNLRPQDHLQPVQVVPTQYLHPQPPNPVQSPPPAYSLHPISVPQHPIYGAVPQHPHRGNSYGSPLPPTVQPYASQSTVRLASPPPQKAGDDGLLKGQLHKLDRKAKKSYQDLRQGAGNGATKLTTDYIERPTHAIAMKSMQVLCQGAALCDIISSKFDAVITSIDDDKFSGKEQDLLVYDDAQPRPSTSNLNSVPETGRPTNDVCRVLGGGKGSNHFSKVWLYSNSRLPPHLPPFKVYIPTYPLLCLAATYSDRVYTPPAPDSGETEAHVPADWRTGTKAMVLKSIPIDDMNTVVFAIRGSQTFMDWAVNYNSAPTRPDGFLDDSLNVCHAGFLYVARKMVKPVAERLRVLLQENPSRSNCSLLITGHSAGGAVAALLYAHMMSTQIESDLSYLTSFFKRVHCVTFGAPPVSLRPLTKSTDKRHRKSLFYAFVNEGDPVPRADKNMIKSLLKLYANPAPSGSCLGATITSMSKINLSQSPPPKTKSKLNYSSMFSKSSKTSAQTGASTPSVTSATSTSTAPAWPIPPCTLSPAGRLVILRQKSGRKSELDVEAVTVDDEMLNKVVYGDPLKHQMRMYKQRVDSLATMAVTAGGC
ncbi:alpha/beta-hydrolase [Dothidotthia symphoricarpi CBS 119687]|uniref:Alpha/beta-hydrolase n=1 Tax=Dothidotthia symphoricarpi CBS 119687 TaxID=1392245 RepID=A0A6A6A2B6_9PLEO|nr:alpha/beta-hydrolase [Dothidotthia symphoricarpi CBS 119687]KAF2125989.1 alpha/beta-hydrolase [Dothidotthia symphoricarpi CBS 119687]